MSVVLHETYLMPDGSEREHVYTVGGIVRPGCSDILAASGFENPWVGKFKRASTFGTALHAAISLDSRGELGETDPEPQFQCALAAWRQWREDRNPDIICVERSLYNTRQGYCGTSDMICIVKNKLYIPDWKTGMYDRVVTPLKMAAYESLVRENSFEKGEIIPVVVLLSDYEPKPREKRYREIFMTDPLAGIIWQSCLNIYRWKQKG